MAPRQNGKNADIEAFEFYLLSTDPNTHILHTAHQVKTSKRAFNRLANIFSDKRHPEICAMVKTIRRTNGEEAIILKSGASIEYSARSRSAARGFDAITLVVYDEAQELTDEQVEALMATLSASPTGDRQLIYAGTPPPPGSPGEVFGRTREKALTDPSKHMSWHEWSIEKRPADDVTFESLIDVIYATNPAMGTRLSLDFTEEEFGSMSADGFARERLGWWSEETSCAEYVIPKKQWDSCRISPDDSPKEGLTVFAVKFSPDGAVGTISACIKPKNGIPYIEVIENRSMSTGMAWFVDFIESHKDNAAQVVVDGGGNAQTLCDLLNLNRHQLIKPTAQQMAGACSMMLNAVNDGAVSHMGQKALDASATMTAKRAIGRGWGFDSTEDADATLIESCALALWSANTTKRDPTRRMRVL